MELYYVERLSGFLSLSVHMRTNLLTNIQYTAHLAGEYESLMTGLRGLLPW